ncbi:pyridoxamine kinase [Caproiciproducens galactitolivorans]|uniref:pyridoxal kinase n=1 Tax=Caproiciproducens galactitolivorans TaxID=642589 RepID=A0A4Z0Y7S8_9FIRM|nr:pyridoxamine kinase [Caproiciproducens galactitolivorans]QEY34876.1 pyridoxamine kinase [Caproiciproducens galactitolivorans]TGJ75585.1 pyridoxine kinase [Caproiciproducens galactitolivorans]
MDTQKRIAAIHDLSGFGKCSLTVALPILSAAGIEVCALPTAVLSSHTGGLAGYTYRDLTEDMPGFARQWEQLGLRFDAIYSGFLGSSKQIQIVSDFFDTFKTENNFIMVDPVMADEGVLYKTITPEMSDGMKQLCRKADLIVPNMTEATYLLGSEYNEGPYTREYIDCILRRLSDLGPEQVVLTGVWFNQSLIGAAGYTRKTDEVSYAFSQKIQGHYYGTGDIFASALLAGLLNQMRLQNAMQVAVDYTAGCVRRTRNAGTDFRYGVNFEAGLPRFMRELGLTEE